MKKYAFLVYHKEYLDFLKGIQDLGVLHVIEKESGEIEDDETRNKYQQLTELKNAIQFLEKRELNDTVKTSVSNSKDGLAVVEELKNLQSDQEEYIQKLAHLKKEKALLEPWGEFSWKILEKLESAGHETRFFICPSREFNPEWENQYSIFEINEIGGNVHFILINKINEEIDIDAENISLPNLSLSLLDKDILDIEAILEKTETLYDKLAAEDLQLLESTQKSLTSDLDFNNVILNTQKEAEEKVMFLEGWVPDGTEDSVVEYLKKVGVYFEFIDPKPSDNPPIKLKNNKFAKLYESIGELYTFPNYKEIDLTPFFAPFYMLFFGFCLGDAGYGILITLGALIGMRKAKPAVKPLLKLGMFLGIATTIMGAVGGTFFGIMLLEETWPWLDGIKNFMLDSDQLMYLALGLGYIQVVFGMFIKAANKTKMYGFKYAISQFGWITIVLIAIPAYGLGILEFILVDIANKIAIAALIVGLIPALFYNTPGKNPLLNLGTGIWDSYQMASGLLGDVLSYIRLFALGISSAILGNVFNSLAMDLSPDIIIVKQIVMILILAFGHSLNFFMAALGSFVHPLRLTFVEFYKNADFMGGGRKYEPFKSN